MKRLSPSNGLLYLLFVVLSLVTVGCSASLSKDESKMRIVNVAHEVEPRHILAGRGDEVRWRNTGTQSIVVSFPASAANRISCRIGFKTEEQTALSALIEPNSFASLCFAQQGKYNYQVRLNQNLASPLTDQRASVWIVGRGERKPDPYEEYTNITLSRHDRRSPPRCSRLVFWGTWTES
jgi:plastocyanin